MTAQRDTIQVIADCLKILGDITALYNNGKINEVEVMAIEKLVQENLDAILRPLYPRPLNASAGSSSEPSGAYVQQP